MTVINCCRLLLLIAGIANVHAFDIFDHLATTTPYRPHSPDANSATPSLSSCRLQQANMVLRHGTRNPTLDTIQVADQLYQQLQDVLARAAVQAPNWLRAWRPRFDRSQAGQLTARGELEHTDLARRLAWRYPDVFAGPYDPDLALIRSTQMSRAERSALAFASGLWNVSDPMMFTSADGLGPSSFITTTGPLNNDPILRPFGMCSRYNQTIHDPLTGLNHKQYMARVTPRIAAHIQATTGIQFPPNMIGSLWKVCKAEASTMGTSDLCTLFNANDILDLELGDDISQYWKKGPGHPINWQMICPLLDDIQKSMTAAAQSTDYHRLDLRFAHAETILPLITSLGLFQDRYSLTSDADANQLRDRSWRMSRLSPYAANVAVLLYQCHGQYLVQILHNEEPVQISFCSGRYMCPLPTFQSYLSQFTSNCNLTQICSL